jgi:hypothetical protein
MSRPNIPIAVLNSAPLTPVSVQTTSYSATANQLIPVDATSAGLTVTLPTASADKSRILIKKIDSSTNAVTIAAGGSDVFNQTGGSTSVSLSLQNQSITVQYNASNGIWYVVGDDFPLNQLDSRYGMTSAAIISTAKADAINLIGITSNASSPTITASSGQFTAADIGKLACVWAPTNVGAGIITTISAVNSSTSVTLAVNAGMTTTTGNFLYGTDDSAIIQAALNAAAYNSSYESGGWDSLQLYGKNQGGYIIASQITIPSGIKIDAPVMLYNMLPNRNQCCLVVSPNAQITQINVNALYGSGVQMGTVNVYARITIGTIRVYNAQGNNTKPASLSVNMNTSGGTLNASVHYWVVTGIDAQGAESVISNEVSGTVAGGMGSATLSWTGSSTFVSYNVYRGTASRAQSAYYNTTNTTYTDTNVAPTYAVPIPPGVGLRIAGYHYEIGTIIVFDSSLGIYQNATDTTIGYADLVGCTTGWRLHSASNTECASVVIDTNGGVSLNGYTTEGGVVIDNGSGHLSLDIRAFQTSPHVLPSVVTVDPYTSNTCGDMNVRIQANNTGGAALTLSHVTSSIFEVIVDNTTYLNGSSQPLTTGVIYGSAIDGSVYVHGSLATGLTPYNGTVGGYLEYVQAGTLTTSGATSSGQPNLPLPSDDGFISYCYDPLQAQTSGSLTSGVMYLQRVTIHASTTVTNLYPCISTSGSGLTTGQNLMGLYSATGTLLSSSSDQTTNWMTSTGIKAAVLTTPQSVSSGSYYVAMLAVGTTPPSFNRSSGSAPAYLVNAKLNGAVFRMGTYGTAQTSLPTTLIVTNVTTTSASPWVAIA